MQVICKIWWWSAISKPKSTKTRSFDENCDKPKPKLVKAMESDIWAMLALSKPHYMIRLLTRQNCQMKWRDHKSITEWVKWSQLLVSDAFPIRSRCIAADLIFEEFWLWVNLSTWSGCWIDMKTEDLCWYCEINLLLNFSEGLKVSQSSLTKPFQAQDGCAKFKRSSTKLS